MFAGGQRQNCVIRNVSETGAKLEMKNVGRVPAAFELYAPGHRPQTCKVVWRSLREMGVQFMSPSGRW